MPSNPVSLKAPRVPEQFTTGDDKYNAQKAWLDGFDTATTLGGSSLADFRALASAMRKVLPPALLTQVIKHLDPLTPFLAFLRSEEKTDAGVGLDRTLTVGNSEAQSSE